MTDRFLSRLKRDLNADQQVIPFRAFCLILLLFHKVKKESKNGEWWPSGDEKARRDPAPSSDRLINGYPENGLS